MTLRRRPPSPACLAHSCFGSDSHTSIHREHWRQRVVRIIGGSAKGRRIETPPDDTTTRPLPDKVRNSVFNMLRGHIEQERVFDCFAGIGTFGLECASRGAREVVMVERDRAIAQLLDRNASSLGFDAEGSGVVEVMNADALGLAAAARCPDPVHIIWYDPPYPMIQDEQDRQRVLDSFRTIATTKLDTTGFALLRVPWPLQQMDPANGGPGWELEGLEGPEIRTYRGMAVLWYMRKDES